VSTGTWFGAMLVGTVGVLAITPRQRPPAPPAKAPRAYERPWLTREAADQIVNRDGGLGPLFADVSLGGPAPSPATRARITEFARVNRVEIRFEVQDGDLAAIRFAVTFGGCCGYEGADTFARRLQRPREETCLDCEYEWVNDWGTATGDGTYLTARVRVNRVEVRWEPEASLAELLERAESVVGQDCASVQTSAGDRWIERDADRAVLEVPFPFTRGYDYGRPENRGLRLTTKHGRITDVMLQLRVPGDGAPMADLMRKRWGRPQIFTSDRETLVWQTRGHHIAAELYDDSAYVSISLSR
jgi:hypothetical protein